MLWKIHMLWKIQNVKDLESILKIFHGCNSTFINSFNKTKFLFHFLIDAAPQFL